MSWHCSAGQVIGPARPLLAFDAPAAASAQLAAAVGARAIVVLVPPGGDGAAVLRLSRLRPAVPIIALAPTAEVARRLVLAWGVHPVVFPSDPQVRSNLD